MSRVIRVDVTIPAVIHYSIEEGDSSVGINDDIVIDKIELDRLVPTNEGYKVETMEIPSRFIEDRELDRIREYIGEIDV